MRRARESATLGSKRPVPSPVMPAEPSTPMPARVWILAGEDEPLLAFAFDSVQAASSGASYVRAEPHDELRRLAQAVVDDAEHRGELFRESESIEALAAFLKEQK